MHNLSPKFSHMTHIKYIFSIINYYYCILFFKEFYKVNFLLPFNIFLLKH